MANKHTSTKMLVTALLTTLVGATMLVAWFLSKGFVSKDTPDAQASHTKNTSSANADGSAPKNQSIGTFEPAKQANAAVAVQRGDEVAPSGFELGRNYSYTDADHERLLTSLETMRERTRAGERLANSEVEALWPQFDTVVSKKFMHPIEALQIKAWLISQLDAPSPALSQRLDIERKATAKQLEADMVAAQKAHKTDPKFLAYKEEERRLTRQMLEKYPDNPKRASQELEKALNATRVKIYSE